MVENAHNCRMFLTYNRNKKIDTFKEKFWN